MRLRSAPINGQKSKKLVNMNRSDINTQLQTMWRGGAVNSNQDTPLSLSTSRIKDRASCQHSAINRLKAYLDVFIQDLDLIILCIFPPRSLHNG